LPELLRVYLQPLCPQLARLRRRPSYACYCTFYDTFCITNCITDAKKRSRPPERQ
jgi:hypothetical protein